MTTGNSPQDHADDLSSQIAALSPEKRRLLQLKLKQRAASVSGDRIEPRRKNHRERATLPLVAVARDGVLPLSFAQQRMWFLDQLDPDNPFYNSQLTFRLSGHLQASTVEHSLNGVIARHEVLRTTFRSREGQAAQSIAESGALSLDVVDLQALSRSERHEEAARLVEEEAMRPFDIERGPLMRTRLLRLDAEEHILVITLHHIAFDGWSTGVLVRDLSAFYEAHLTGAPASLPELPIQYADFARWQRKWLQGEELQKRLSYWTARLEGLPTLQLPTDHPRPARQSYRGSQEKMVLAESLKEPLEALALRDGGTLYMLLLAAFKTLLYRYSGQADLVVGSPIAGRTWEETEDVIGCFVNTLVLRTDLSGEPEFRELVRRVRDVALGAYEQQDLPFERLVEELQPERDLSRNPLFQVLFTLQNVPRTPWTVPGLTLERIENEARTTRVDLEVEIREQKEGLGVRFVYSTDLFEASTIRRMLRHFRTLLEEIIADPDRRLSELPLLGKEERERLLVAWNETTVDYRRDQSVHGLFEEAARRAPAAVAVECEGQHLTYAELNGRANQLAHYLIERGVRPGELVGIRMERGLEMVVGLLGVLKAGGAYLPLDPSYPAERLDYVVEHARVELLLTDARRPGSVSRHRLREIGLVDDSPAIRDASQENPRSDVTSRDLAYVIYTSGSTGQPKGVEIEHRSVVNFLQSMRREPGLGPADRLLAVTTLAFDIAALEVFLPLVTGARCVLVPREVASDGAALVRRLEESRATVMQATPATYRLMVEAGWVRRLPVKVLCGGEALPRELGDRLLCLCSEVWNLYGPSETTIWSSVRRVEAGKGAVLIGGPIANTRFYVLDGRLQPVPEGAEGELYIGGDGLARGYLHRAELTAESFVPDPFSGCRGARLYRTGDRVRYRGEGALEFLGRLDQQLKLRGFRIEPGEIEAALRDHPAVQDGVVVMREDRPGDKRLVAYWVVDGAASASGPELRAYLASKLPDYMVPSHLVPLEELPLTPNRKVDRGALPAVDIGETERPHVEPRDALEFALAGLWKQVLGVKNVCVTDSFFELGGHSLLAAQLFARIAKIVGRELPLALLFRAPTIEGLAALLRDAAWEPDWSSLVAIRPTGGEPPLYLVHGAEGNVLLYRELADRLPSDQPVFGLQAPTLDGSAPVLTRLEDMASHYIEEIQAVQPTGPYYLGGYCLGGTIALEMARQLDARGESVALVVLLETYNIQSVSRKNALLRRPYHFLQNLRFHIDNLMSIPNEDRLKFLGKKMDIARARLALSVARARDRLLRRLTSRPRRGGLSPRVSELCHQAQRDYRPKAYSGRVVLFRPQTHFRWQDDPQFGWGDVVKERLEIEELPLRPRGMLVEPFVGILAERLERVIEGSRSRRFGDLGRNREDP